jgi:ferredoxin-NADP reductase
MTDAAVNPIQPAPWQTAAVKEIVVQTPRIKSFILTLSQPFSFVAGQHVDVRLTAADGYRAIRSYSMGSAPDKSGQIELAIECLDDGEVSPFFHEVTTIGDEIELRGPLGGHFIWSPTDGGPILLVGGGSGVVPLMSMIRHHRAAVSKVPILLLLSARIWEDVLYRDELYRIQERSNGFFLILTLTRDEYHATANYTRRIDAAMMAEVIERLPGTPKGVFVCGSNQFVNSATDGAIAVGVPPTIVRTERYGV